jgi:uncharacterized protein (DUF1800 family)
MHTERRTFLHKAAAATALLASGISTRSHSKTASGNENGLPPPSLKTLTLNRCSFGITQSLEQDFVRLGQRSWLEQQMRWEEINDSETEAYLEKYMPTLSMSTKELSELENKNLAANQLVQSTVYRAMFSQRQLYEVMVEFWSNHFSIYIKESPITLLKTIDDREVIRPHAMGTFRDLLHATSKSPAMLMYLDNFSNIAGTANENYARELLELHTLGLDGGYTEQDVQEVARCFTGWTVGRFGNPRAGEFIFSNRRHDQKEKVILDTAIPANGGITDGEQVIDMLASHPSTARFISTKLVRRFVSDEPPENLVDTLTDTFLRTDGDIKSLLWDIFLSDEFEQSADQKLKRPLEFMVGAMRSLGARPDRESYRMLRETLSGMGQMPFHWIPPDGYPDTAGYWSSSNGLLARWNFASNLAGLRIPGLLYQYRPIIGNARQPETIVEQLSEQILQRPLTDTDKQMFVDYLNGGTSILQDLNNRQVKERIPTVIGLMLSSNYFQYR